MLISEPPSTISSPSSTREAAPKYGSTPSLRSRSQTSSNVAPSGGRSTTDTSRAKNAPSRPVSSGSSIAVDDPSGNVTDTEPPDGSPPVDAVSSNIRAHRLGRFTLTTLPDSSVDQGVGPIAHQTAGVELAGRQVLAEHRLDRVAAHRGDRAHLFHVHDRALWDGPGQRVTPACGGRRGR